MTPMERPEFCTDEMLEFLDELRKDGATNMFGAGPYLEEGFEELQVVKNGGHSSSPMARSVLRYWMETFKERHPR